MKRRRHVRAGDIGEDLKAIRKEILQAKAKLGKVDDAAADEMLPPKKRPTSVRTVQGGQCESNRSKF